jgi:CheY-like chemotaxis protein
MEHTEFVAHVRDALTHLYDPVHLQSHPLAAFLAGAENLDQVTRAQKLRRRLLDALEQLSPPADAVSGEAGTCYHALHYRYLDGLGPEQIADLLAISPRQAYRKIREGVEAIASLLWDQLRPEGVTAPEAPQDRRSLAQATVQHLGSHARPEVLELRSVLSDIVKDLHSYCGQIGAEILLQLPPTPLYVCVDRTMLRQALFNLLTGGLDRATGRSLVIAASRSGKELRLTLDLPLGNGRSPGIEGVPRPVEREGIGLEVATQLFRLQGIRMRHDPKAQPWHVEICMLQTGPHHVLVVDDMPDIPLLFQRFATTHAVEVIGAENADQAFDILQHLSPTLILLDVMLPRRDGWEILQTLKSDPTTAHIPVVICSILNEPDLATALGADGYLRKPISQEALLQVLERWLHQEPEPAATRP